MQLLPNALAKTIRNAMLASHTNLKKISYDSMRELVVERVEADEVQAGNFKGENVADVGEVYDADSVGRAVGPGAGEGGGRGQTGANGAAAGARTGGARVVPGPPTVKASELPLRGTHGWEKYDQRTNNGFPQGTCGVCGVSDHFRSECPHIPHKGYTRSPLPSPAPSGQKPKAKAKAKSAFKRQAGAVDDEAADEEELAG